MNASFQLIVFDWDGTLVDSEARIVLAMQDGMRDIGLEALSRAQIKDVIGLGLSEAIAVLLPDHEVAVRAALADAYRERFLAPHQHAEAFPDAGAVLAELAARGLFLGVATGKSRRGLDRDLVETGFRDYFHATRCADETRSKPHPQMLFEVMERVGVGPRETLMVGDSEYDLLLAKNAGADAVAVAYGVHDRDRLATHGPLTILERLGDLPAFLTRSEQA